MAILASLVQAGPESGRDDYSALDERYRYAAVLGQSETPTYPRQGVVWAGSQAAGALEVTAQTTPNMSVRVNRGQAIIHAGSLQAAYVLTSTASLDLSIDASSSTNGRLDLIVAKVDDEDYGDDAHGARIYVITGTPSSVPTEPAVPTTGGHIVLARVAVPAGATSITNGRVTPRQTYTTGNGGVLYAPTASELPSDVPPGQMAWLANRSILIAWDGSAWRDASAHYDGGQAWMLANQQPGNVPPGALQYTAAGTSATETSSAATFAFSLPYTGGIKSIVVGAGDSAGALHQTQIDYVASSLNTIVVTCRNQDGTGIFNTQVRMNYIAVGWDA